MAGLKSKIADYLIYKKYSMLNLAYIASMVIRHGLYDTVRDLRRYPWILDLLKVNSFLKKLTESRTGEYRKAVALTISTLAKQITELLERGFHHRDRLILHEDLVPPEIFYAMGLKPWTIEALGLVIPMIVPHGVERYIDICENEGVPADVCSFTKVATGMILGDHLPDTDLPLVTSNLPCDGGMTSYTLMKRKRKVPMYTLDIPYNFRTERAVDYLVEELKDMIKWLEKNSPGKIDWDRLKDICEARNKMVELELELWDMVRRRPSPMAAEVVYLSHLWTFNTFPGMDLSVKLYEKLVKMCRKNMENNISAVTNERYRAVLWNPPTMHAIDLFVWAEKTYGVSLVMDMLTYNMQPFIDTSNPESMLKGLAYNIMDGPMVRHTRGLAENYYDDIFNLYKTYDLDMVWIAGHIGCKNAKALTGMLREKFREKGIPLLIIDYDFMDPRIESREGIIKQVENFMENIMKAERLGG